MVKPDYTIYVYTFNSECYTEPIAKDRLQLSASLLFVSLPSGHRLKDSPYKVISIDARESTFDMQIPSRFKTLRLHNGTLEIVSNDVTISHEPQLILLPKLLGICRSDIKEFMGTRTVRHDFGHEILAEVLSNNNSRLPSPGNWVVLDPHIKITRSSGFGDLIIASGDVASMTKAFITVPRSIAKERLVFVEPLACAHHCVSNLLKRAGRERLDSLSVGVFGAGMTGTLIAALCRLYGANVTLINRSEERLNFLRSCSFFDETELSSSDDIKGEFDAVIPTTTFLTPDVLKFCESIVKNNGILLLYGGTKTGDMFPGADNIDIDTIRRTQSEASVITDKKTFRLCGSHGAITEDFETIVELLKNPDVNLPVEKLIGRTISLDDVPEVIAQMSKKDILGKTLVTIDQPGEI